MPSSVEIQQARRLLTTTPTPEAYQQAAQDLRQELPGKATYWDRRRGVGAVSQYVTEMTPELFDDEPFGHAKPLSILEIGPGVGIWLEFARAAGHEVEGVDTVPATPRIQLFEEMTLAQDLDVVYVGFDVLLAKVKGGEDLGRYAGAFHLIHARGSLDAVIGRFPEGIQRERVQLFARTCCQLLKPGGMVHVCHNTDVRMELIIEELRDFQGLRFEQINGQTTRHWLDG